MAATVLVVEDDRGLQESLEAILQEEGYEVVVAGDGREALSLLQQLRPGLIVLDLMMPRMDGRRFMEELRQLPISPPIPVLIVTADGRAAQKAAEAGAQGHLEKPFELDAFLDAVSRLLSA